MLLRLCSSCSRGILIVLFWAEYIEPFYDCSREIIGTCGIFSHWASVCILYINYHISHAINPNAINPNPIKKTVSTLCARRQSLAQSVRLRHVLSAQLALPCKSAEGFVNAFLRGFLYAFLRNGFGRVKVRDIHHSIVT